MLRPLHPATSQGLTIDRALHLLKQLAGQSLQAYLHNASFDAEKWFEQHHKDYFPGNVFFQAIPELQTVEEWVTLTASLAPHVDPGFYQQLIIEYLPGGGDFPEFGGVKGTNHRGLLPTGETIQFILAGLDVAKRLKAQDIFSERHFFFEKSILWLEPVREGEPFMSGRVIIRQDWLHKILTGEEITPRFGLEFPARRITTSMNWDDIVLNHQTRNQVDEIVDWLDYYPLLARDKNLVRKIKPGYRVLFHGPPGTGKTLTAALLGKRSGMDVYRIDLSRIVSKYIGETEKNLEIVFKNAESKNWILFFDEADALFGKRTNVQSSHDKYANQEVSYLLQRVEDYAGLLILASNFKNNLDDAFLRRFHSLVYFPIPSPSERLILWQKTMPSSLVGDETVDLSTLAKKYELTGASILNAVQYAALQCFTRKDTTLSQQDLLNGVRKEYLKEGKSF